MRSPADDVLDEVATVVLARDLGHPVRVAVDGVTAAGKTTFAEGLAAAVRTRGRTAIRVTMDGFHHPGAHRHRQGRMSADGYYEDAYDFAALRRELLAPLGPGGARRYRTRVIDLATDARIDESPSLAGPGDVLVLDGSFLQRPEVRDGWDHVVWLDVDFDTALARGVRRDAVAFGGADAAAEAFRQRYHAAGRRYLHETDPVRAATVVVDNTDPVHPRLVRTG